MEAVQMKTAKILMTLALVAAVAAVQAQTEQDSASLVDHSIPSDGAVTRGGVVRPVRVPSYAPFSRLSLGFGVSPLGPQVQLTTNLASHLNLRATGSGMGYTTSFNTNGFDANARLNLASAGLSADIYPFRAGFRISPGILVLNNNRVSGSGVAAGGTSITLNDTTYYSANANSVTGATPLIATADLGLHSNRPAFTLTTGWGNTIPRKGGHWSFPFEVGAAFIGAPSIKMNLTGWVCQDQAQTDCSDVTSTTNSVAEDVQTNLNAQIAKWQSDLEPLKYYPILSFGVSYSFNVRNNRIQ
jgi:hypothetical protein